MALTKMGNFTFLHANQIDALYTVYTSTQIKAFFDSQATELKSYLNNTLTVELDSEMGGYVPTTRTVNGKALSSDIALTASDVGLGNVTNESKATMFTNPVFTGNVTGVSQDWTKLVSTTWSGTDPYTQTISVNGLTSNDKPIINVVLTGAFSTDTTLIAEWSKIYRAVTSSDTLALYATSATTTEFSISIKVVR